MSDRTNDFSSVLGAARELLVWEAELDGIGIPATALAARPAVARDHAPAAARSAEAANPQPTPPRDSRPKLEILTGLATEAATCTACVLHAGRTKSVFARGSA